MTDAFYTPTVLPAAAHEHTPAYAETDLASCESEPIHIPGAIQPHGVLLAVDGSGTITTVSTNSALLLGPEPARIIGQRLAEVFGHQVARLIEAGPDDESGPDLFTVRLPDDHPGLSGRLAGTEVDVRTHRSGDRLVVELEDLGATGVAGLSLRSARRAIGRMAARSTVAELADQLATETRTLLGFDRVMVYRFDESWNGEVIAESKHQDLNSFFGLHYPASDIPAQARRLYTVNWTRLIADIGYTPVPLTPLVEVDTGAPLDLSASALRSVSPIHVEYLGNMGVTASMSVSIVVEETLWGLVACHHYSGPLRPTHDARSAAELLGQVASQMFFDREQAERREAALALSEQLATLLARVELDPGDPVEALLRDPELVTFLGAGGVAVHNGDQRLTLGATPGWPALERIAALLEDPDEYATAADDLADLDPSLAGETGTAAGALRIGSSPVSWMLWVRPEIVQTVEWGGDPTNKLLAAREPSDVRLSPRKSFEKWRQEVQGRSRPWTPAHLEAASTLGIRLQALVLAQGREQMAMAESLQRSVVLDAAPVLDGIEVAARYLPSSTYRLAGDWWDAIELDEHRTAFVVGDVAGHGVRAASVMVQVRTSLRAYLFEGHEPMDCLNRLDAFIDSLLADQLVTAVVAVADRRTREVTIARAGHPPAITAAAASSAVVDSAVRPILGVALPGGRGGATTLRLGPGTALLLYTDGLVERRGENFDDSVARLIADDVALGDDTLDDWLGRVVDVVGADEGDDTTLLAFRWSD